MDITDVLGRVIKTDSVPKMKQVNGQDVVKSVVVETEVLLKDNNVIKGTGISHTHPDDMDLATVNTGIRIAQVRSYIDILNQVLKMDVSEEEKGVLLSSKKVLENENKAFINRKEDMYARIRANRAGDKSNKIRQFILSEDGKKSLEVTGYNER